MTKQDVDILIGRTIEDARNFCIARAYNVEFYPLGAILTNNLVFKTLKFWHHDGIIKGWTIGNPWELSQ